MIITKLSLERRTFLRGVGATIALPFLDAMVPALSAATASAGPLRLGFVYVPNGMFLPNFHPEGNGGTNYTMTPVLKPIEALREHVVVVSGLSNMPVLANDQGGGVHTRNHAGWLSGVLPKRTEGANITSAKTVDQYAADKLGADTPLRSLELTLESNYQVGNCEAGYSCAYLNSTSWRAPNSPLPHESDPRVVFQRLFGDGGSVSARLAQMQKDRSILDSVMESVTRLEQRLGVVRSPGHGRLPRFGARRRSAHPARGAVERDDAAAGRRAAVGRPGRVRRARQAADGPAAPGVSGRHHARQLSAGRPRVERPDLSVDRRARGASRRLPPSARPAQHRAENQDRRLQHVAVRAICSRRCAQTPDGDGSLLDHALFMYGAGMGDGDRHTPLDLPVVLAGGARGQLTGGRHLRYEENTPFMNLCVTLLDKVGVTVDALGDSTGRLTDL